MLALVAAGTVAAPPIMPSAAAVEVSNVSNAIVQLAAIPTPMNIYWELLAHTTANAGALTRPGRRVRLAVKEVREQVQAAVQKLGDSVRAAVGADNRSGDDAAEPE